MDFPRFSMIVISTAGYVPHTEDNEDMFTQT